jgi:hypothetical protein
VYDDICATIRSVDGSAYEDTLRSKIDRSYCLGRDFMTTTNNESGSVHDVTSCNTNPTTTRLDESRWLLAKN